MRIYADNDLIMRVEYSDIINSFVEMAVDAFILQYIFQKMIITTNTKFLAFVILCSKIKEPVDSFIMKPCRCTYCTTHAIFQSQAVRIAIEVLIRRCCRQCSESTEPASPKVRDHPGRREMLWRVLHMPAILSRVGCTSSR